MSAEKVYIRKRKRQAFLNSLCFYMCRIFPIKKNRVSVCTFEGRNGFCCNPKYIVEELHRRNPDCEFVWFVNDMNKQFPEYIKKVPNTLWSRAYWLSISGIWIDNYRKPYGTIKRKGQCYINTWHATISFKSIGLWRGEAFSEMAYLVSKNDSDMIDRVVIDSKWCAEMYRKGLLFEGEYLWAGAPRCDILYGDRTVYREVFRKKYGIPSDAKVVMYAPTFREGSVDGKRIVFSEIWTLDFARLIENFKKRFGGDWYLCLRVHPQLAAGFKGHTDHALGDHLIDTSKEEDMSEILAAMDACITDYSSVAVDASYAHMPVFLYADDIEKYIHDRGGMQWNFSTDSKAVVKNNRDMTPSIDVVMPYSVAQNNEEMEENILNFDEEEYEKKLVQFEKEVELVFDGKASEKVCEFLENYMK